MVEPFLLRRFRQRTGRDLDIAAPRSFSEKLFVRMIMTNRHGDARQSRLADKLAVRDHVAERIGAAYLPALLWHGADPAAIPFDALTPPGFLKIIPVRWSASG